MAAWPSRTAPCPVFWPVSLCRACRWRDVPILAPRPIGSLRERDAAPCAGWAYARLRVIAAPTRLHRPPARGSSARPRAPLSELHGEGAFSDKLPSPPRPRLTIVSPAVTGPGPGPKADGCAAWPRCPAAEQNVPPQAARSPCFSYAVRRRWSVSAAPPASITPRRIIAHSDRVGTGAGGGATAAPGSSNRSVPQVI